MPLYFQIKQRVLNATNIFEGPFRRTRKLEEELPTLTEKTEKLAAAQKLDLLAKFQSDHLAFLKNLKEILFRDVDRLKKYSEIVFEEQNKDRLQEILIFNFN